MLKRLKKLFQGSSAEKLAETEAMAETRSHSRFIVDNLPFLRLEYPKGQFPQLKDISYGGVSVVKSQFEEPDFAVIEFQGNIHLFDKVFPFKARKVHDAKDQVGFQFVHESGDLLLFLRPFLEDFRCGTTMVVLNPELLKESFRKNFNYALRGDGPCDLYLDFHNGQLQSALMTQRSNQFYHELRWHKGVLQTGRILDEPGAAPRVSADPKPDPNTLKKSLQILAGAMASTQEELPALTAFYRLVEQTLNQA